MARTVNASAHAAKRDDILAAAQRLVETHGYEQMTIQDLLDELGISKGALYHYFASKPALLEALVERMLDEVARLLLPIAQDTQRSARDKLQHFFTALFRWRAERRETLLALLRVWYADENALVREKVRRGMLDRFTPLLADILRQGVEEGSLTCVHPDQVARVVVHLRMGLSETVAEWLLTVDPQRDDLTQIDKTVAAFTSAIACVLGVPAASLEITDAAMLRTWLTHV